MYKEIIPAGSEEGKKLDQLYALDRHIRGSYILQANWIEQIIQEGIVNHFCPNNQENQNLLRSLVLKEVNFSSIINIFINLIETEYPKANVKINKLRSELEKIRDLRNKLAHAVIDTSDEFLAKNQTDRIRLEFFKKGKKEHLVLTTKEIQERLGDTTAVTLIILNVNKHIRETKQPAQ